MPRNSSRDFRRNSSSRSNFSTEEIQIKDLDLELELLRRKREILELQAQTKQYSSQAQYDNPPRHGQNSSHNFSYLYEDTHGSRNDYGQYSSKKRYNEDWSASPAPKRSSLSRRDTPKQFGASRDREMFDFERGQRSLSRREQKNNHAPRQTTTKDMPVPLMSLKTKSAIVNKLNKNKPLKPKPNDFQPSKVVKKKAANKNKPSVAISLAANNEVKDLVKKTEGAPILSANKVPTQQMAGRLELALGNIIKTIKTNFGEKYADCFTSSVNIRDMKQIVRQRLRNVMMGKPVGAVTAIVENYRKVYPNKTDHDIVVKVSVVPQNEDKEKICLDEENLKPSAYFKNNFTRLLEETLDKMFVKLTDLYKNNEDNQQMIDNTLISINDSKEAQDFTVDETIESNKPCASVEKVIAPNKYEMLMRAMLEKELPIALPKFKRNIIRLLNMDKYYKITKLEIKEMTARLLRYHGEVESTDHINDELVCKIEKDEENSGETQTTQQPQRLPYYVKIVGRPSLPKRNLMQTFLDEYRPKSIKKVKLMGNLLFVGFESKDNFDRICAANNTVIGNNRLIIKVSKWVTKEALEAKPNEDNVSQVDEKKENVSQVDEKEEEKTDFSLQSIDDQIDHLLTSIRREEESSIKNNVNGGDNEADEDTGTECIIQDNTNVSQEVAEDVESQEVAKDVESEATNETTTIEASEQITETDENHTNADDQNIVLENNANENTEAGVEESNELVAEIGEENDSVSDLKADAKDVNRSTPTRSSSRLASVTPSTVRTRRASRLANDN